MTNYSRGAKFENDVKKDMQASGWFVVRSAGSHGPVDLVAQSPGPVVAWVQCKRDGNISLADRRGLFNIAKAYHAIPVLAFKDNGIEYREIRSDDEEKIFIDWHPSIEGEAAA